MGNGKTIMIFFDDGIPDGIITDHLSNWNGMCIKVPRDDIQNREYGELDINAMKRLSWKNS